MTNFSTPLPRKDNLYVALKKVRKSEAKLLVNLTDYIDTGLFLEKTPVVPSTFCDARKKATQVSIAK